MCKHPLNKSYLIRCKALQKRARLLVNRRFWLVAGFLASDRTLS